MKNQDFATFMSKERERLNELKTELTDKLAKLNEELETTNRSLHAMDVYEQAQQGKFTQPKATRAPKASTGARAPRDGSMRGRVTSLLSEKGALGRADIIDALGIKGDKKKEQNLSNLLVNMKKAGIINHNKDKTYTTSDVSAAA